MPIMKASRSPRPPLVRVGLSNRQKPTTLLSTFREKAKQPESITAPPLSSDEEDDYRRLRETAPQGSSDDDDDDGRPRGEIVPTVFNSTSSPRRSTREKVKPSSQGKRTASSSQTDESSRAASTKRPAEESKRDSHFTDQFGFIKKQKTSGHKRPTTYGKGPSQPRSSQPKGAQRSAPASSVAKSPTRKRFIHHSNSSSPERAQPPQFKTYGNDITPEKDTSCRLFIKPPSSANSSPRSRRKVAFRHRDSLSDEPPERPKFKTLDVDGEPEIRKAKSTNGKRANRKMRSKSKTKARQDSPTPVTEESRPIFKTHVLDESDYIDDDDAKPIVLSENRASDHEEEDDIDIGSRVTATARCPMCHDLVDSELLAKHSDHGRMNIRKQTAFCRLHKRKTALSSADEKGYPNIDWEALDTRFGEHQAFLRDILEGVRPSHYANILKDKVESGKNRTLLKTEDSLTPGYYGPRGLRAMTDYIMRTLSPVVRKRAVEDRLVSARGYTGYVQAVLVPELAIRLIAADMRVIEEDARKIMEESIEYGELMHEDAGDVIVGVSDEDECI
ncbi:hypothetical protein F4779DRAFT_168822 [Xylariaceae sp. FL0662B]|nr:hypothetical protein F4779DRAFT_168822 [Xylariaceae sp. FL0662B]